MSSPPMEFPSFDNGDTEMQGQTATTPSRSHRQDQSGTMLPSSSDDNSNSLFLGTPTATPAGTGITARRALESVRQLRDKWEHTSFRSSCWGRMN